MVLAFFLGKRIDCEKLFADSKLSPRLAQAALSCLTHEELLLQTPANLWLAGTACGHLLLGFASLTPAEWARSIHLLRQALQTLYLAS
jgi:hypothetical protein